MRAYYMRVGDRGAYKGYVADTEPMHRAGRIDQPELTEMVILDGRFVVICEAGAVLSGKRLNRVLYDRSGKPGKVFAGDLMILRYERGVITDIRESDQELLEQLLKPIERIAYGKVFLKDARKLPKWREP